MNRIRMFDYLDQFRAIKPEVMDAVERVLESGNLILGPEVAAFETAFAAFLGGTGQCVGVNSGTDALAIALRALDIGPGDDVITVSNTAVPTVSAICSTGANPVFCDVDAATGLIDIDRIPELITRKTRAIIPVHLFGNVVDLHRIRRMLIGQSISIIEDCAQAHGAFLNGRAAGTTGDIGAFSFYPTKNLGAFGDAGICWSAKPQLVEKMRSLRMYGFEDRYYSERHGINSRMDEIQAAFLSVKLKHLPFYLKRRRELASLYDQWLDERIERMLPGEGVDHAWHLYVVKVSCRDRIRNQLMNAGIETGIHYPCPVHLMNGYRFLGYEKGSLPRTEDLAGEILSLPLYPELAESAVKLVCKELNLRVRGAL